MRLVIDNVCVYIYTYIYWMHCTLHYDTAPGGACTGPRAAYTAPGGACTGSGAAYTAPGGACTGSRAAYTASGGACTGSRTGCTVSGCAYTGSRAARTGPGRACTCSGAALVRELHTLIRGSARPKGHFLPPCLCCSEESEPWSEFLAHG